MVISKETSGTTHPLGANLDMIFTHNPHSSGLWARRHQFSHHSHHLAHSVRGSVPHFLASKTLNASPGSLLLGGPSFQRRLALIVQGLAWCQLFLCHSWSAWPWISLQYSSRRSPLGLPGTSSTPLRQSEAHPSVALSGTDHHSSQLYPILIGPHGHCWRVCRAQEQFLGLELCSRWLSWVLL